MFTGIIENVGFIEDITHNGTNHTFSITSPISHELKIDQSVSHDGVCLTVESISDTTHTVTAIAETLEKTALKNWLKGKEINLERCMKMNGRIDGHIVQGHVDTTAVCINKKDLDGSWQFTFEIEDKFAGLIVEKGSISINGISLTIFDVSLTTFTVAIIPYTMDHTTMRNIHQGTIVNIEFDMIGKYVNRIHSLK